MRRRTVKKGKEVEVHDKIMHETMKGIQGACSSDEVIDMTIIAINGWANHIDYCLSRIVDILEERGCKKNASDSEEVRGDDAG